MPKCRPLSSQRHKTDRISKQATTGSRQSANGSLDLKKAAQKATEKRDHADRGILDVDYHAIEALRAEMTNGGALGYKPEILRIVGDQAEDRFLHSTEDSLRRGNESILNSVLRVIDESREWAPGDGLAPLNLQVSSTGAGKTATTLKAIVESIQEGEVIVFVLPNHQMLSEARQTFHDQLNAYNGEATSPKDVRVLTMGSLQQTGCHPSRIEQQKILQENNVSGESYCVEKEDGAVVQTCPHIASCPAFRMRLALKDTPLEEAQLYGLDEEVEGHESLVDLLSHERPTIVFTVHAYLPQKAMVREVIKRAALVIVDECPVPTIVSTYRLPTDAFRARQRERYLVQLRAYKQQLERKAERTGEPIKDNFDPDEIYRDRNQLAEIVSASAREVWTARGALQEPGDLAREIVRRTLSWANRSYTVPLSQHDIREGGRLFIERFHRPYRILKRACNASQLVTPRMDIQTLEIQVSRAFEEGQGPELALLGLVFSAVSDLLCTHSLEVEIEDFESEIDLIARHTMIQAAHDKEDKEVLAWGRVLRNHMENLPLMVMDASANEVATKAVFSETHRLVGAPEEVIHPTAMRVVFAQRSLPKKALEYSVDEDDELPKSFGSYVSTVDNLDYIARSLEGVQDFFRDRQTCSIPSMSVIGPKTVMDRMRRGFLPGFSGIAADRERGRVDFSTSEERVAEAARRRIRDPLIGHFGAIRGLNSMKGVDVQATVGRPEPAQMDVASLAYALYAACSADQRREVGQIYYDLEDPKKNGLAPKEIRHPMRDGRSMRLSEQHYRCPWMRLGHAHIRHDELVQTVGRARATRVTDTDPSTWPVLVVFSNVMPKAHGLMIDAVVDRSLFSEISTVVRSAHETGATSIQTVINGEKIVGQRGKPLKDRGVKDLFKRVGLRGRSNHIFSAFSVMKIGARKPFAIYVLRSCSNPEKAIREELDRRYPEYVEAGYRVTPVDELAEIHLEEGDVIAASAREEVERLSDDEMEKIVDLMCDLRAARLGEAPVDSKVRELLDKKEDRAAIVEHLHKQHHSHEPGRGTNDEGVEVYRIKHLDDLHEVTLDEFNAVRREIVERRSRDEFAVLPRDISDEDVESVILRRLSEACMPVDDRKSDSKRVKDRSNGSASINPFDSHRKGPSAVEVPTTAFI